MESIMMGYMGRSQNCGFLLGTLNMVAVSYAYGSRDHNFDDRPYGVREVERVR